MQQHEKFVCRAFDRAAATYNQFASMQVAAGHTLIRHLSNINNHFTNILDAGCGTGIVTNMLANAVQHASLHAVDISSALLAQAKQLSTTIQWENTDFNDIQKQYDLIFSNMALHWSRSLPDTLRIFQQALNDDGMLAFTMPLSGTFNELPETLSIHDFLTSEQITTLMQQHGFQVMHASCITYQEYFDDTLSALRSIKSTGTCHVSKRKQTSLRGKAFLQSLSFMQLSYVTGFFIGRRT